MCDTSPGDAKGKPAEPEFVEECGRTVPAHLISRRSLLAGAGAAAVPLLVGPAGALADKQRRSWWGGHGGGGNAGRRGHYLIKGAALVSARCRT